jgi:flagellin-specific chaperone FliS
MNTAHAYRQDRHEPCAWYRIDLLLAAYDGTIDRIEQAQSLLKDGDRQAAWPLIVRAQRIILELYGGLNLRYGVIPENMQKLYLYTLYCLSFGDREHLDSAESILRRIREGLRDVRDEAVELEVRGELHPVDHDTRRLLAVG